jgi:transcriptional regulator with XRE-family HTH domain
MEIFLKRLKGLRAELSLTQKELAEKIGMSYRGYQKIESGESEPGAEKIIALADVFETTTDYLLGRSDIRSTRGRGGVMY